MDNITQTEMLINYGIFCLERQKDVLTAYRKIRSAYIELMLLVTVILALIAGALTSIAYASMALFDGWAAAILSLVAAGFIALFVIYAKIISNDIHNNKAYIAEACNVYTTLSDIIYIVDRMNGNDTED